jgi:hypothetical protein
VNYGAVAMCDLPLRSRRDNRCFKSLSHAKGIFEQSRWNMTGAPRPPFGVLTSVVTWYLMR